MPEVPKVPEVLKVPEVPKVLKVPEVPKAANFVPMVPLPMAHMLAHPETVALFLFRPSCRRCPRRCPRRSPRFVLALVGVPLCLWPMFSLTRKRLSNTHTRLKLHQKCHDR